MEVDLAVVRSSSSEECVTPRDSGSRIPAPAVCPPAPRKKQAVFDAEKRQKVRKESPPDKKKYVIDEAALELLFSLVHRHGPATKNNNNNGADQRES